MAKSWGRGLNEYRDMVKRVMIDSDDPNFDKVDLDMFADGVHELVVGGPRNVRIQRQYGEGFRVVLNGKPHGDQCWYCFKHQEVIEEQGPGSAYASRGYDGRGGWSRSAATQESTQDFDEAMAIAQKLAKLPERKANEYKPDKPLTAAVARDSVYASAAYGLTSEERVRAMATHLEDKEHVLPCGIEGFYLNVDNGANVVLKAGDTVFLNDWGRINGALTKKGQAYELTAS